MGVGPRVRYPSGFRKGELLKYNPFRCAAAPAWAGWQFAEPLEIAPAKPGVFHHLDASGRNALAVSPTQIAIVWEDNRAGASGCYLAIGRPPKLREFRFGQEGCYEPGVTALGVDPGHRGERERLHLRVRQLVPAEWERHPRVGRRVVAVHAHVGDDARLRRRRYTQESCL